MKLGEIKGLTEAAHRLGLRKPKPVHEKEPQVQVFSSRDESIMQQMLREKNGQDELPDSHFSYDPLFQKAMRRNNE